MKDNSYCLAVFGIMNTIDLSLLFLFPTDIFVETNEDNFMTFQELVLTYHNGLKNGNTIIAYN